MSLSEERTDLSREVLAHSIPTAVVVANDAWIRKRGIGTALNVAYWAAGGLFFSFIAVWALVAQHPGEALGAAIVVELMMWTIAGLCLSSAVRMARAGVRISARGVSLRGVFRTRHLPLTGVERFEPGVFSSGLLRSQIGVTLIRDKGHPLQIWALRGDAPTEQVGLEAALLHLQPLCDELNLQLAKVNGEPLKTAADTSEEPLTRAEADKAYRTIRAYLVGSALWFLAIAAVIAVLDFSGWQVYLGFVVLVEGIGMPLFLRFYRRDLDRKVRAGEEALGRTRVA
jgi:hypothetical protein